MTEKIIPEVSIVESARVFKIIYPFLLCCLFSLALDKIDSKNIYRVLIIVLFIFTLYPKINNTIVYLKNGNSYNNIYENDLIKKIKTNDNDIFRVVNIPKDHINSLIAGNILISYGLEQASGYGSMHPKGYNDFWLKATNGRSGGNRLYLSPKQSEKEINFNENFSEKLLRLSNVKYIFSEYEIKSENIDMLYEPQKFSVIKNKRIRYFKISDVFTRIKEIFKSEKYNSFYIYKFKNPIPRFVYVKNCSSINYSNVFENMQLSHKIAVNLYSPDSIDLNTFNNLQDACIFVSNNYSKFWKLKINNNNENLELLFGTFWKINLLQGDNNIVLKYDPPYKNANLLKVFK